MKPDPIVEDIRKIRDEHASKFNYDLSKICADLREKEQVTKHPVVSRQPKLKLKQTGS